VIAAVLACVVTGFGGAMVARSVGKNAVVTANRIRARAAHSTARRRRVDLEMLALGADELVMRQVFGGLVGAASVVTVAGVTRLTGAGPSLPLTTIAMVGGALAGFVAPDVGLRRAASRRRRQFVHALSSFLDVTTVLLAGGAGLETALTAAARSGGGDAFTLLRGALASARDAGRPPWIELRTLGRRLGVDALVELADSLDLAGSHGARIRESLVARSEAMRARIADDVEASAHAATERMGLPMVLVFVGFLALIVYPALSHLVIGG